MFWIGIMTACTPVAEKPPNIVYILADDLGYGDLSCLNPESKIQTPNLDRLAEQGIVFTDAHSGSAVCTPTRYGVLTGRYSWRSALKQSVLWPWDKPLIEEDRLTVGNFLKQHGYTTACIGKWHLGWEWQTADGSAMSDSIVMGEWQNRDLRIAFGDKIDFTKAILNGPTTRGFDYYFGDDVPNFPPYCFIENSKTTGIPTTSKPQDMFGFPGPMLEGWDLAAVMPAITNKAVAYIRAKPGEGLFKRAEEKPFFLYFALTAPHTPIAPADQFKGSSRAGAYGDFVQEVDWTVGQVLDALEATGQAENTLLIFTSDNGSPARDGTNMAGPTGSVHRYGHHPSYQFRGMKADIWEGGHHVPFLAAWPGKIQQGTRSDEVICHTDLLATCAAILNAEVPPGAGEDSYNILPALLGQEYEQPIREATVHHSGAGTFAIRQEQWKLILGGGSGGWTPPRNDAAAAEEGLPMVQLYDLSVDIGEQDNVWTQYPEVVDRLTALLKKYQQEGRSVESRR
jgi:arylsulfatase A-like enzyme